MNAKQFSLFLFRQGACSEATEWAKGKSLKTVWKTCKRGDWLLWLCGRMAGKPGWPTHKQVVLAACDCAELALVHVPEGEDRPRKCIEITRKWALGRATIEEVKTARDAAAAVAYAAAYTYAAAAAANAAAASAAADAANAVAYAAAYAADAAAAADRPKTLAKCACLVRARLRPKVLKMVRGA